MATTTYTALEKLYGLKLFHKLITEDKIPASHKTKAIKYYKTLESNVTSDTLE